VEFHWWMLLPLIPLLGLGLITLKVARVRRRVRPFMRLSHNERREFARLVLRDRSLPLMPRVLVALAAGYLALPIDLIPDFIPFLGEVDDLYLLILALQRLIANAGRPVLIDHWTGNPADLADLNLRGAIAAAAFFLPKRIRRRLRVIGR